MMKWWKRLIFSVISLVLGYISLDYLYSAFTKLINASGSAAAYSPKGDGLSQLLGAVMFLGYFVVVGFYIWIIKRSSPKIDLIEEVVQSNITYGQLYGNLWQIENGRIFQIGGLFLFGMIAGRLSLFKSSPKSISLWKKITLWSALLFIPLNVVRMVYPNIAQGNKALLMPLDIAIPSILCAFLSIWLVRNGQLTVGELVGFVVILEKFVESIIGIPFAIVDATGCMVCIGRLEGILSAKDEHFGDKTYKATNIANSVSYESGLDVDYVIEFDNIKFAYKEGENVLNDVSFKIKNGENIAIVGSSGGGKTTIFRLLCGLYHASAGTYKLYGMDINEWNIESARENMALVSQDTFLFTGTIEENIRYGNINATHDEVVNACKDARIHDFIEGLTDGYETVISEGGSQLSGGQRQRIAIARAILKNTPILLLDEPTSAIDEGTEQLIQDALDRLCKGKTSITIAHRLSTIKDADRIIVLQQGKIVEAGTHKQLLDMGGVYAEMYAEG